MEDNKKTKFVVPTFEIELAPPSNPETLIALFKILQQTVGGLLHHAKATKEGKTPNGARSVNSIGPFLLERLTSNPKQAQTFLHFLTYLYSKVSQANGLTTTSAKRRNSQRRNNIGFLKLCEAATNQTFELSSQNLPINSLKKLLNSARKQVAKDLLHLVETGRFTDDEVSKIRQIRLRLLQKSFSNWPVQTVINFINDAMQLATVGEDRQVEVGKAFVERCVTTFP